MKSLYFAFELDLLFSLVGDWDDRRRSLNLLLDSVTRSCDHRISKRRFSGSIKKEYFVRKGELVFSVGRENQIIEVSSLPLRLNRNNSKYLAAHIYDVVHSVYRLTGNLKKEAAETMMLPFSLSAPAASKMNSENGRLTGVQYNLSGGSFDIEIDLWRRIIPLLVLCFSRSLRNEDSLSPRLLLTDCFLGEVESKSRFVPVEIHASEARKSRGHTKRSFTAVEMHADIKELAEFINALYLIDRAILKSPEVFRNIMEIDESKFLLMIHAASFLKSGREIRRVFLDFIEKWPKSISNVLRPGLAAPARSEKYYYEKRLASIWLDRNRSFRKTIRNKDFNFEENLQPAQKIIYNELNKKSVKIEEADWNYSMPVSRSSRGGVMIRNMDLVLHPAFAREYAPVYVLDVLQYAIECYLKTRDHEGRTPLWREETVRKILLEQVDSLLSNSSQQYLVDGYSGIDFFLEFIIYLMRFVRRECLFDPFSCSIENPDRISITELNSTIEAAEEAIRNQWPILARLTPCINISRISIPCQETNNKLILEERLPWPLENRADSNPHILVYESFETIANFSSFCTLMRFYNTEVLNMLCPQNYAIHSLKIGRNFLVSIVNARTRYEAASIDPNIPILSPQKKGLSQWYYEKRNTLAY